MDITANYRQELSFALLLTAAIWFFQPVQGRAQLTWTGFVRNYNALQTVPDHELLIGRNRVRLNLEKELDSGEIVVSGDLQNLYSVSIDSNRFRVREAYVDLYFDQSDVRIGRQMIVWGRSDGTFVTDILTPVDLTQFLTQDFPDLRMGTTALSYTRYFAGNYLQVVLNPVFHSNEIPDPGSRWFPRPVLPPGLPLTYRPADQAPALDDVQAGVRWALRSDIDFDLDIGALYWRHPSPRYAKELAGTTGSDSLSILLNETFRQGPILFYSGTYRLADRLLLKSETAYYFRRQFDYLPRDIRSIDFENPTPSERLLLVQSFGTNTDGFLKERPWLVSMVGLQYDTGAWTVSGQFVNEHIFNYSSSILQEQDYPYVTLLLQKSFLRDRLDFTGFARYNATGGDFWVNPELTYRGIDNIEVASGGQLFGGTAPGRFYGHLSFDNFSANSFLYLQFSAYF